jgi:DNA (cytosine-5)-methyltransferase 1
MQQSIFDIMFSKFKITKPIRLIELFAGYGSQALALKYLGVKFEHWKIVEWAIKSIQAYKDVHYTNIDIEFNKDRTKEEIVKQLYKLGVSSDYNNPLTKEQLNRYKLDDLITILKNIAITKNLVNICNVKGKDLEIIDTDKYEYIMTYSFPCQDLSLAGLGKGMARDSGTRSGMLWEIERILDECEELPQILLMENVPQVIGTGNVEHFNKWQLKLESLGYKNYHQNLIATDYGIPQTRNRTFMVSILGEYSYTFPQPIPLKLKLKDMLEKNVSERYYLSSKQLEQISNWNAYQNPFDTIDKENCPTLTTRSGAFAAGMVLTKDDNNLKTQLCNTLIEKGMVKENDVIKHSYTDQIMSGDKKYVEMNNIMPTMTTRPDCLGIVVKEATILCKVNRDFKKAKEVSDTLQTTPKEGVVTIGNYSKSNHNASRIVDSNGQAPTVMENHGTITATIVKSNNKNAKHQQDIIQDADGNCRTIVCGTHGNGGHYTKTIMNDLRIRKLSTRECFRLMGVKDEDYENIAKNQSDSSLYHLAGDSIVVNVLMAIFKEMLGVD